MATRPRRPARRPAPAERPRGKQRSDFLIRLVTVVPWIVLVIVVIGIGGAAFDVVVAVFGLLAAHELYALLRPARPIVLAGFLGIVGLVAAAALGDQFQIVLVIALSVFVTFLLVLVRPDRSHATIAIAVTLLGVVWIGIALAHAVLLRDLPHGDGLVIDVLAATFIGDTAAYLGGLRYGTRPLAPRLSPNKTLEGLLFGFIGGTLAFWVAGLYQDWISGIDALMIGAGVAAVAPLGDLFESLVKRDLQIKDTGRFFGAHGGVLDRLDAVFFTVVAGYYLSRAVLFG